MSPYPEQAELSRNFSHRPSARIFTDRNCQLMARYLGAYANDILGIVHTYYPNITKMKLDAYKAVLTLLQAGSEKVGRMGKNKFLHRLVTMTFTLEF
jgi:hypothetical protein